MENCPIRRLLALLALLMFLNACMDGESPAGDDASTSDSATVATDHDAGDEGAADAPDEVYDGASSRDDAAVEDAGSVEDGGSIEDAAPLMDGAADGSSGDSDGGMLDADMSSNDGGSGPSTGDGGAGSEAGGSSASAAPCLVTRTVADGTLLVAPGHTSNAALTATTVIGFVLPSSGSGYAGWSLWSRSSGAMLADSLYLGLDAANREAVLGKSGTAFVVKALDDLVLRAASDGHELWRLTVAPAATSRAGVASDASYVWLVETSGGTSTFKAYAPGTTTPLVSAASTPVDVWAEASGPTVLTSDSTSTTLTRYPRSGSPSVVGPVVGRFSASFGSHAYFITKASGGIVRVFAPTGAPAVATVSQASDAEGGAGGLVWLYSSTNQRVDVYKLSDTSQPLQSFTAIDRAPSALSDGFVLSDRRRVKVTGETLQVTTPPGDDWVYADFEGADVSIGSSGIHVTGLATAMGCGQIVATAADAHRAYVSTSWGGTFVYEGPFQAPIGHLDTSGTIVTTRSSTRFAIVHHAEDPAETSRAYVYEPNLSQVAALALPRNTSVSLSADGTRIGLGFGVSSSTPDAVEATWKVVRVSDSQELLAVNHTYTTVRTASSGSPVWTPAPSFSPSGNRMAFSGASYKLPCGVNCGYTWNTTYIHEGTTLLGTFPGDHGEWIDEGRLLGKVAEGASIISARGIAPRGSCLRVYLVRAVAE